MGDSWDSRPKLLYLAACALIGAALLAVGESWGAVGLCSLL
jgi:hypothetical protein